MSVLLSDHLPLLASAPDGIQKLRGLILELAVRGKLVLQDPDDEPASELLKRIAQERARLEKEGICKKSKAMPLSDEEDCPFKVPAGWTWVRLAEIGHDWGQKTPDVDFTYIDVSAIDNARGVINSPTVVAPADAPSRARKIVRRGTVIYSTVRPYLLNIAVIDRDLTPAPIASTAFAVIHPLAGLSSQFIFWYLRSPVFVRYVESVQTGIAYPAVNDSQFFSGLFPLPPVAEQHRIVAKVDELMALCDRMEAEQADAASAHARLVETLLGTLTLSTDATDVAANWQRLAEHFDTLFSTEASIDTLKLTILQLAVMGKLVPQSCGESASIGKLRDFVEFLNGYSFKSEWFSKSGVRLLRNANVAHGYCDWKEAAYLPHDRKDEFKRFALAAGDLVLSLDRPIINTGLKIARVSESDLPCLLLQRVAKVYPINGTVDPNYLYLWFNSPEFVRTINPGRSNGIPHISTKQIGEITFMRFSLAEQHRIVAKVDELMVLVDRLKADLIDARTRQAQLASTLIESALQAA